MTLSHLLVGFAVLVPCAHAQDIAMGGSENYVLAGPALVGGGGVASSVHFRASVASEVPGVPQQALSPSFRLLAGPALFGAAPAGAPILFDGREGTCTKDGGQAVTLFGRDLGTLGAGASSASFGSQPLTGLTLTSSFQATGFPRPRCGRLSQPTRRGRGRLREPTR